MSKSNYAQYLRPGETLEQIPIGTLRKRKWDAERRLSEEQRKALAEERRERAIQTAKMRNLDMRFWGDSGYDHPAETVAEEIAIHRLFLRALRQEDVKPGETLRELAFRTYVAWLDGASWMDYDTKKIPIKQYGVTDDIGWVPAYIPSTRSFAFEGFAIKGGGKKDWFENNWVPPADCKNGEEDQPIDVHGLDSWPITPEPEPKIEEVKPVPSPVPEPPSAPVVRPPSLTDYSSRDYESESAAQCYLAGRSYKPDKHPERSHLSRADRRFLYGENI